MLGTGRGPQQLSDTGVVQTPAREMKGGLPTPSSHLPQEVYQLVKQRRPVEDGSQAWGEPTEVLAHGCDSAKGPHLGGKREAWQVLGSARGGAHFLENTGFAGTVEWRWRRAFQKQAATSQVMKTRSVAITGHRRRRCGTPAPGSGLEVGSSPLTP